MIRMGAALVAVASLLAPALWNGFPLLQYDTGGYLARWFEGYLVPSRSVVYGLFVAAGWPLDFWPVVIIQAAATVWKYFSISSAPASLPSAPSGNPKNASGDGGGDDCAARTHEHSATTTRTARTRTCHHTALLWFRRWRLVGGVGVFGARADSPEQGFEPRLARIEQTPLVLQWTIELADGSKRDGAESEGRRI